MERMLTYYGFKLKNNKMCCPFHKERTASFSVKDKIFKCFGCGNGGDIFDFIMGYYNLDFRQAVLKINTDFTLGLINSNLSKNEIKRLNKQIKMRNAESTIKKIQLEKYRLEYDSKADEYRKCSVIVDNLKPKSKLESIGNEYANAIHRLIYLEHWFEYNVWR